MQGALCNSNALHQLTRDGAPSCSAFSIGCYKPGQKRVGLWRGLQRRLGLLEQPARQSRMQMSSLATRLRGSDCQKLGGRVNTLR